MLKFCLDENLHFNKKDSFIFHEHRRKRNNGAADRKINAAILVGVAELLAVFIDLETYNWVNGHV
jgi:hypothetical protein